MRTRLWSLVLGVAIAAGAAGVGLAVADVDSPVRTVLVLLFLALGPTAAIYGLLGSFDGLARLVLACSATIVVLALTAMIMLAAGGWHPVSGLLAVAAITALCVAVQLPPVRRAVTRQRRAAPGRPGPSQGPGRP
jgi:uncharacterized membrane protein